MAIVQVRACDICEATKDVVQYTVIGREREEVLVDLCGDCSAPIDEILVYGALTSAAEGPPPPPKPRPKAQYSRRPKKGIVVKSLEEIEAEKQG